MSDQTNVKIYKCDLCSKIYQNRSGLRKHKIKPKSCLPDNVLIQHAINSTRLEETVKKLLEENEKLKQETVRKLEENEKLKKENEIIRLQSMSDIKTDVKIIKDELLNVGSKIELATNNSVTAFNNCVIQNNNNDNKKLKFSIKLADNEKERYDHIHEDELLYILDQEDFSDSIADLVQAVSFNPKAPENMTWCINDKKAEQGAIEYDPELNMLIKNSSTTVISKNLQTILFPVTDMLKVIQPKNTFTKHQNRNYDRYFDILGQDTFKKEYINCIRDRAFDKRGLCKALWEHLDIGLHSNKIKNKLKLV